MSGGVNSNKWRSKGCFLKSGFVNLQAMLVDGIKILQMELAVFNCTKFAFTFDSSVTASNYFLQQIVYTF
jgi:hypothetical protein